MKYDHINLLPNEKRRRLAPVSKIGMAAVLGVVVIAAIAWASVRLHGQARAIESEIAVVDSKLQQVKREVASLPDPNAKPKGPSQSEILSRIAKRDFAWSELLKELSLLAPEDLWLVSLTGELKGDVADFVMIGEAGSQRTISGFLRALENSDHFRQVKFKLSERMTDVKPSLFRFQLDCPVNVHKSRQL